MTENYILKIKNKKYYLFNKFENLVGVGGSYELAYEDLNRKILNEKVIKKEIGVDISKLNSSFKMSNEKFSYMKKWFIAFIFVSLMSISFSYSISNGIKNAINDLEFPKGNKIWTNIGDEIIKIGQSETMNSNLREEEINEALKKIKKRIYPYLDFFSLNEDCK